MWILLKVGLQILKNKVLKIFSEILFFLSCLSRGVCSVGRKIGWCGAICGVIADKLRYSDLAHIG